METLRLAWQLFRLARYLYANRVAGASASINLVTERRDSASYIGLLETARKAGAVHVPPPREGVEVAIWLDNGLHPHKVKRGATLADAIAAALDQK